MNTMVKRGFHLAALVAIGVIALSSGRFSKTADAASPTPIPVSSCTALGAGAYRLTTNITTSGTCFTVTEGTAFDLGSKTLTGDNTGYGISDGGSAANNVIITNGTIKNFGTGIGMYACCGASYALSVDGVNALNNNGDGIYSASCCNTFSNIKASNNAGFGINNRTGEACCSTFANVQANNNNNEGIYGIGGYYLANGVTANGNLDNTGIDLQNGYNTVVNSVTNSNHGFGMYLDGSYNSVEGSTADSNTNDDGPGDGIRMTSGNSLIDHSVATGNQGDGIGAYGENNLITNSTANSNGDCGIFLPDAANHVVLRDVTGTNGDDGVFIACPGREPADRT